MQGADGTNGGIGQFFIGLGMMIAGFYLLLNSINVTSSFGFAYNLYSWGGYSITSGMVMFPFMFGIGIIFYNSKNPIGWLLAVGALIGLIAGVIASIRFNMRSMSAFDLITILVLSMGGLGLFMRSLKDFASLPEK